MFVVKFCRLGRLLLMLVKSGIRWGILGILKDGRVGKLGRFDNVGSDGRLAISILVMPKFLICGIEKPSKLSKPVKGAFKASLGLSSEDELDPLDDDGDEEDDEDVDEVSEMDDDKGDDVPSRSMSGVGISRVSALIGTSKAWVNRRWTVSTVEDAVFDH